jgi:RNA polymerase sigma-54 factor
LPTTLNLFVMASPSFEQSQKLSQSLTLAPQLRQSLKILQVPAVELRTTILAELQANPLLEELPMEVISLDMKSESEGDSNNPEAEGEMDFSDNDFSTIKKMEEDWRDWQRDDQGGSQWTQEESNRREHFFNSLTEETSLQEHLLEQTNLSDLAPTLREALYYLIGSLDDRGFLSSSLSDLALSARIPFGTLQTALDVLQQFDPAGIGATNLRECLLLQLRARGQEKSLASKILNEQYDLLLRRRIPDIARKTGASITEIEDAIQSISELDPSPGSRFESVAHQIVEPDVSIIPSENGEWQVLMHNEYIPKLRLNPVYKEMLGKDTLSKKDRDYLREQMRAGRFLMNSIDQRQQTIERIAREILSYQQAFFEEGVSRLKPLTMNSIAEIVGVHETTVSRAIANKFMRTPHGVFPMKYFFTPGYTDSEGESVSNKTIKDRIQQIVQEEDSAKPFSDEVIMKKLKESGITIARRTIAKYRDELGILPTNLRRRYN